MEKFVQKKVTYFQNWDQINNSILIVIKHVFFDDLIFSNPFFHLPLFSTLSLKFKFLWVISLLNLKILQLYNWQLILWSVLKHLKLKNKNMHSSSEDIDPGLLKMLKEDLKSFK